MIFAVYFVLNELTMKKLMLFSLLLILTTTYTFSQGTQSKKESLIQFEKTLIDTLVDQLASGKFYFEATWATTSTGERINLATTPNFLQLNDLHAVANLPYFGIAHSPAFTAGGINFDNAILEYDTKYSDKNERTTITYSVKNKTELFAVILTVFENKKVNVAINSNYRGTITYSGNLLNKKLLEQSP